MTKKTVILFSLSICIGVVCPAQVSEQNSVDYKPNIHGTIRAKYEYQPEDNKGRFEVRNARVSVDGNVARNVSYKAEIDLSDEGEIKMLDAYARLAIVDNLKFTAGQFRVPFTIDAHRSPHMQYFANRSFIAKEMGSVRDVGATLAYSLGNERFPISVEAGLFNGLGITDQKLGWTNTFCFSAKAILAYKSGSNLYNLTLSTQKRRPNSVSVMMYDAGAYFENKHIHAEVEYMYKHYSKNAFTNAHALDVFVSYGFPLNRCFFSRISPLFRFDYMTDNSDGENFTDESKSRFKLTDYERSRITAGVTLTILKPFATDIRLNYENYFYRKNSIPDVSEKDKFVIELMARF